MINLAVCMFVSHAPDCCMYLCSHVTDGDPGVHRPDAVHAVANDVGDADSHGPPAARHQQSARGRTHPHHAGPPPPLPTTR